MTKWIYGAALLSLCLAVQGGAASAGDSVVVVYNKNLPESKQLAEHYAARRAVPASQLLGIDVSAASEVITRADFRAKMEKPIFDWLVKEKLFTLNPVKRKTKDTEYRPITQAKVRYLVLCYGVPLKIARDLDLKETGADKIQEELKGRNEAAVDADLAILPFSRQEEITFTGPAGNPFYLTTNAWTLHPTNGLLMVARLDGPTVEIARGLVDKALEAESDGLWGRSYIDTRGITNGTYKMGDDWMRAAAAITHRLGYQTEVNEQEGLFPTGFPMSHLAFYAGWYDTHPTGALASAKMEFMPGAFAYHLHSFSASTLRSTNQYWVGPLLAKGATITMGCVDEPYLAGTPNIAAFLERIGFRRWTFGEAAYTAQASLSWQTTVVGDPLYRPYGQAPDALHLKLEKENNPLVAWSHLRVVGLNEATGLPVPELIKYLDDIPAITTNSAVLLERRGHLRMKAQQLDRAVDDLAAALKVNPSAQQKIWLLDALAQFQAALGRSQPALDTYKQLVAAAPNYFDHGRVYSEMARLARELGQKEDAEKFAKEAQQLGAAPK
jgi:uncharacterized protein (TIGR03790 family)